MTRPIVVVRRHWCMEAAFLKRQWLFPRPRFGTCSGGIFTCATRHIHHRQALYCKPFTWPVYSYKHYLGPPTLPLFPTIAVDHQTSTCMKTMSGLFKKELTMNMLKWWDSKGKTCLLMQTLIDNDWCIFENHSSLNSFLALKSLLSRISHAVLRNKTAWNKLLLLPLEPTTIQLEDHFGFLVARMDGPSYGFNCSTRLIATTMALCIIIKWCTEWIIVTSIHCYDSN